MRSSRHYCSVLPRFKTAFFAVLTRIIISTQTTSPFWKSVRTVRQAVAKHSSTWHHPYYPCLWRAGALCALLMASACTGIPEEFPQLSLRPLGPDYAHVVAMCGEADLFLCDANEPESQACRDQEMYTQERRAVWNSPDVWHLQESVWRYGLFLQTLCQLGDDPANEQHRRDRITDWDYMWRLADTLEQWRPEKLLALRRLYEQYDGIDNIHRCDLQQERDSEIQQRLVALAIDAAQLTARIRDGRPLRPRCLQLSIDIHFLRRDYWQLDVCCD